MAVWWERQKNVLDVTLASLLRRKGKNLALLAVYTAIVFLLASVMFLTYALKREAAGVLADAPEIVVQRMAAGRHDPISLEAAAALEGIPGVQSVRGRLWGYYYDPITGANYTLMVPGEDPPPPGKIEIGEGVARTRLLFPGDTMEFRSHEGRLIEWEVARVLPSASSLVSADLVLLGRDDFRTLFGGDPARVTDLVVRVRNSRELAVIAEKIAARLPDTRTILREEILRTYEAVFNWRGGLLILILLGSALAFVILAWDKASGLSPEERREIGILKAVGWETSDVILLKLWEGLAVSLSSFLLGLGLAYAHVFFAAATLFEPVLKGWAVLYPRFALVPYIDGSQVAALFFLTVIPYTVATVIPSWRAATTDPDSVMR